MINFNTPIPPLEKSSVFSGSQKSEAIDDIKNNVDNNDLIVINKLSNLRSSLNAAPINLPSIKQQIENLSSFNNAQNYAYLSNLLCPEKARGCKMPSQIPVPSCSFQLHNSISLTTNASGNLAFLMNPCFLASDTVIGQTVVANETDYYVRNFLTSAWINNDAELTGAAESIKWRPINFFQTLPDVYDSYRLVSASIVIKYIGRIDQVKGEIGGAIFYDQLNTLGGQTSVTEEGDVTDTQCPMLSKYAIFDYALDSFYSQTNSTLEGVRMLYFPLDNSYEEYTKVMNGTVITVENQLSADNKVIFNPNYDYYKSTFNWFFWARGCPESTACFKADIYCNFECLPNAKFLNYMPISINNVYIPPERKKEWITAIQHHPIMKANEDISGEVTVPDIFIRMIKKFRNGIPGFDKLRAMGLIGSIPSFKPGLALAGTMMQSNMMLDDY